MESESVGGARSLGARDPLGGELGHVILKVRFGLAVCVPLYIAVPLHEPDPRGVPAAFCYAPRWV
jgi:hypothetical protein